MNLLRPDSPLLPRTFISLILVVIRAAVIRNAQLSWCMGKNGESGHGMYVSSGVPI